jgi:hypothetical protein
MGEQTQYALSFEPSRVPSMVCRKCGSDDLRREHRRGFLQMKDFPIFGFYPWECIKCGKVGSS